MIEYYWISYLLLNSRKWSAKTTVGMVDLTDKNASAHEGGIPGVSLAAADTWKSGNSPLEEDEEVWEEVNKITKRKNNKEEEANRKPLNKETLC